MFFKREKCGVEFPVFLVFFSMLLGGPISYNFVMYRTCYVIMERDELECAQLGVNTTDNSTIILEKEVQVVANYINIAMEIFLMIVPCIVCMFVGPYSDIKGRRRILIISLTGAVIAAFVKAIIAIFPKLSPWYLSLQIVPILMSGGTPTFTVLAFCYLVDVTKMENRSMRLGLLEGALGSGLILGLFLSSYVFLWIGYAGTFFLSFLLMVIAWLFTILFVPESIKIDQNLQASTKFFTFAHIKEMLRTTLKPREGYNRFVLLGCIGAVVLLVSAEAADGTEALLLRSKFHWDLEQLTNFGSIRSVVAIASMCICIYVFQKLLQVPEGVLIVVGLVASAAGNGIVAFADYDWQIYAAACVRLPAGLISPMIRSIVSNLVPQEDTGKVFAFCVSLQSLCSLLVGPFYTIIYTNTLDVFPGAFDLIPVAVYLGLVVFFVYVSVLMRRPNAVIFLAGDDEKTEKTEKTDTIDVKYDTTKI